MPPLLSDRLRQALRDFKQVAAARARLELETESSFRERSQLIEREYQDDLERIDHAYQEEAGGGRTGLNEARTNILALFDGEEAGQSGSGQSQTGRHSYLRPGQGAGPGGFPGSALDHHHRLRLRPQGRQGPARRRPGPGPFGRRAPSNPGAPGSPASATMAFRRRFAAHRHSHGHGQRFRPLGSLAEVHRPGCRSSFAGFRLSSFPATCAASGPS